MQDKGIRKVSRYAGIIGSYDLEIIEPGNEIWLYKIEEGDPNILIMIGRILTYPPDNPTSLWFDRDDEFDQGKENEEGKITERKIIPQGSQGLWETEIKNPYKIDIHFTRDNALINIELKLRQETGIRDPQQETGYRELSVKMMSAVRLRR